LITLFWCLLLVFFLLYVFSLLMVQLLIFELQDRNLTLTSESDAYQFFGSVEHTVLSLLMSTTGGADWGDVYAVLLPYGTVLPLFFVLYILFFMVALWNVVTSAFVDKAVKMGKPDAASLGMEQKTRDIKDGEELVLMFKQADLDESRGISKSEFRMAMANEKFTYCLQAHNIDIANAESLFDMLISISGKDEVDIRTLVGALLRLRGNATSIDLHALSFRTELMSKTFNLFVSECFSQFHTIKDMVMTLHDERQAEPKVVCCGGHHRVCRGGDHMKFSDEKKACCVEEAARPIEANLDKLKEYVDERSPQHLPKEEVEDFILKRAAKEDVIDKVPQHEEKDVVVAVQGLTHLNMEDFEKDVSRQVESRPPPSAQRQSRRSQRSIGPAGKEEARLQKKLDLRTPVRRQWRARTG